MKKLSILLLILACPFFCKSQGTLTITFDGPPQIQPGTGDVVYSYYESGMQFLPGSSDGYIRIWGNETTPRIPNDGTAYIQASAGDSLSFGFSSGAYFNLVSIDLAAYSTVVPNFSVDFIGSLYNGGTVSTNFSGNGINFQTFHFGPQWSGLTSVEIPNDAWSLDNLVVSVPEPAIGAVFLAGGIAVAFSGMKRRRQL
jgi:hypothetical protein